MKKGIAPAERARMTKKRIVELLEKAEQQLEDTADTLSRSYLRSETSRVLKPEDHSNIELVYTSLCDCAMALAKTIDDLTGRPKTHGELDGDK